jgi:hypothetical protein
MNTPELSLRKPNAALVMMPRTGKLTGIQRKLINSILMSSISQLDDYRFEHQSAPPNTHEYSAPADALLDPIEIGKSNLKGSLKKYLLSLRHTDVDWEAPDEKSGVIWTNMSILSQVSMSLRAGRLWAQWALPPHLNAAIANAKEFPFTRLDLNQIAKLQSYTSVALYEICARYKNNYLKGGDGVCLTGKSDPDWWVDALTNSAPKLDKETGKVVRREWRKLKSESVLKAIDEINRVTDLNIELLETKHGKAVAFVQFSIRQKKVDAKEIEQAHFELLKTAVKLGLSELSIQNAITRTSANEVSFALAKFEGRVNQSNLGVIKEPERYFATLLLNSNPIQVVANAPAKSASAFVVIENVTDEQQQKNDKLAMAKAALLDLDPSQKQGYADRALIEFKNKGMADQKLIANVAGGVWGPMILAKMVEIFISDIESERTSK